MLPGPGDPSTTATHDDVAENELRELLGGHVFNVPPAPFACL
eukprot:COSAG05_NODE_573_length_8601_cov_58.330981_4_plen_42_part_00